MDFFPDESIMSVESEEAQPKWRMYLDGAVNIHGNGIGAVIICPIAAHSRRKKLKFPCTNNIAEYKACIIGLKEALDMSIKDLEVFADSILIISQSMEE